MDVLNYVNATPNAIGYAEADALPYFPNVATVPIGDSEPTRKDALDGTYPFVATEYLYTAGDPQGLTRDFITYLTDGATSSELRGHGYIGCSDLSGTKLGGACAGG
jgi:ABC-type phosphate transport system substrate-binding protein